jgi:hypothetical protein
MGPRKRPSEPTVAREDVAKLAKDQNPDGGWGYLDGMRSDPFVTAEVLVALATRKPPTKVMQRALAYVRKQANAAVGKLEDFLAVADTSASYFFAVGANGIIGRPATICQRFFALTIVAV